MLLYCHTSLLTQYDILPLKFATRIETKVNISIVDAVEECVNLSSGRLWEGHAVQCNEHNVMVA